MAPTLPVGSLVDQVASSLRVSSFSSVNWDKQSLVLGEYVI